MKLCFSFVCARALVPLGRCFTETTSAAIARDSRRPSTQARYARVRMGLVHPANHFPAQDRAQAPAHPISTRIDPPPGTAARAARDRERASARRVFLTWGMSPGEP